MGPAWGVYRRAAARIPHCDLITITAGHHIRSGRPEVFADAVVGWLRG